MPSVGIVTDSTNCLPPEVIEREGIRVVPVGMVMQGKAYRDLVEITADEFWKMFPTLQEQPTTTAGIPGDFVNAYRDIIKQGRDVICILVSKALTATQESAYLARKLVKAEFPKANIQIVDSRTSAGALGFIALEAARAANQGKPLAKVAAVVEDMCARVIYLSAVETLKYMIKIGRAPRNAQIGEMLGVKPIIGFVDDSGFTEVVARTSGKDNALKKVVDLVKTYVDTKLPLHVIVSYSTSKQEGENLLALMKSRYKCVESYLTQYSPTMVAATGPMVGVSFYA